MIRNKVEPHFNISHSLASSYKDTKKFKCTQEKKAAKLINYVLHKVINYRKVVYGKGRTSIMSFEVGTTSPHHVKRYLHQSVASL